MCRVCVCIEAGGVCFYDYGCGGVGDVDGGEVWGGWEGGGGGGII